jgi:RimJ/RimL family protein N-acetyltransferase
MFARTERLLLRPSWPEDAAAIHAAIADEAVVRNLARAPWPYTACDAAEFAKLDHPRHFPNFMLMLRTDGAPELVGSCGLAERNGEAELGYWIARPHWGKGLAGEAANAVVEIARALGHRRLVSGHFTDNIASGKVLLKAGFRPTGTVEQRYSAGRGRAAPCALFERELDGEVSASPEPRMPALMHAA